MIFNRPVALYLVALDVILNAAVVVFGVELTAEALGALNAAVAAVLTVIVGVQLGTSDRIVAMRQRIATRRRRSA